MSTAETHINTQLIEDYLHTTEILVDLPEKGTSAVVAPYINHDGQSETLVVTQDESGGSSVYQVVREPKSDSGWNESTAIHKPKAAGEKPIYVSQYVTELSLTKQGTSVPLAGQSIQLSTVESLAIWDYYPLLNPYVLSGFGQKTIYFGTLVTNL